MDYITISEARERQGLRLVLLENMPSPWSLAARAIFDVKDIDYASAGQGFGQDKTELIEWTGQTSLPVVAYNNERLLTTPESLIFLAERLNPTPQLIPDDREERATMFGLLREIAGENGLGWYRRIEALGAGENVDTSTGLPHTYGYREDQKAVAEQNVHDSLLMITARLRRQQQTDTPYLVGKSLTAVDLYAAIFLSILIKPVSNQIIPLPDMFRQVYGMPQPKIEEVISPEIEQYRLNILEQYVRLPVDY